MICPFCGSTDIHGPSRMTVDWQATAGSPLHRQWYLPAETASLMACSNCHEEFDSGKWFGGSPGIIVIQTAA